MSYITVSGGATKTKFLDDERCHSCLLKVMYSHSTKHRFPTNELYQTTAHLSMKQYVLCTILNLHKTLEYSPIPET